MESAIVQNGKFRVFENGEVYRIKDGTETKCNIIRTGKTKKYCVVTYCENGKQQSFYVHRLVAEGFLPNPNNYPNVSHKDNNLENNCVANLEWVSQQEIISNTYKNNQGCTFMNLEPCIMCGSPTAARDGICPECKKKLKIQANKQARVEELQEEMESIDPNNLNERALDMVQMRKEGATLQEIGDKYQLSRERVRQILNRAKQGAIFRNVKTISRERDLIASKIEKKREKLKLAETNVAILKNEIQALEDNYALLYNLTEQQEETEGA